MINKKNTIIIRAVMDEQWSFTVFCRRTKATLKRLLTLLDGTSICYFMTDGWPVYLSVLLAEKHIIGKRWTQRIERHNLNLRTHIKR